MFVIGDVHGKFAEYKHLLGSNRMKGKTSVQIGDFGLFDGNDMHRSYPSSSKFFRGNHDHPDLCRAHPNYLGDWGYTTVEDGTKFFWVSGAWSVDWRGRTPGISWWPDEELSIAELHKALDLYEKVKPEIVLSHDGPDPITSSMMQKTFLHKERHPSRTAQALSAMFRAHQPALWCFGHWHINWAERIGRTQFRCLAELGWMEI